VQIVIALINISLNSNSFVQLRRIGSNLKLVFVENISQSRLLDAST